MKKISKIALLSCLAFCSGMTEAAEENFSGTRIVNNMKNGSGAAVSGTFTGTTTLNYTNGGSEQGALHISTAGTQTVLEGKIDIRAENTTNSATYVNGIRITASGTALLKGEISIEANSYAGSGIKLSHADAYVKLDSGDTGKSIIIKVTDPAPSANHTTEASAIYASAGTVDVVGNLETDSNQMRGYGLWTGGSSGKINVIGNTTLVTHAPEAFGIRLDNGEINLNGNLTIITGTGGSIGNAGSAGLRGISGTLTVSGSSYIETHGDIAAVGTIKSYESSYGIWNTSASRLVGDRAQMTFGAVTIKTDGQAAHGVYNDSLAGSITFKGDVNISTTGNEGSVTWNFGSLLGQRTYSSETVGAYGVSSALSGTTIFEQNLTVQASGTAGGGIRNKGGLVQVQGNADISTLGARGYGIYGTGTSINHGGITEIDGFTSIHTSGSAAHAVYADNSAVIRLNGGAELNAGGAGAFAISGTGKSTISGSGQFAVTGSLQSSGSANVALAAKQSSTFNGDVSAKNFGKLTLDLADHSALTGNVSASGTAAAALSVSQASVINGNLNAIDSGTLTVNLVDDAMLSGTAVSADNAQIAISVADRAVFVGSTGTAGATDVLDVQVSGHGLWTVNADSFLTTLTMNGGTVDFQNSGNYKQVTAQTLTGSGGAFIMNTEIAANSADGTQDIAGANSDFITISGTASGSQSITIRDRSNGAITGNEYALWLVNTGTSESATTFSGTNHVTQGATTYTYTVMNGEDAQVLVNSGSNTYAIANNSSNDWYLLLTSSTTSNAGKTVVDVTAANRAAWFLEMDTLLKRMGELRLNTRHESDSSPTSISSGDKDVAKFVNSGTNDDPLVDNIWVRGYGAQYNMSSSVSGGSSFRQYIYGVDAGLDHSWLDDEAENIYYLGVYGGYGRADQTYRSYSGEGNNDSYYGGFYGTWLNNDGWYADLVGKASYFDNGFEVWDDSTKTTGDYGNWATGISLELGRQFQFKDNWYVEPQVQASYVHFFGGHYTTGGDNRFGVDYGDADVLQFRYGSLFGRTIKLNKDDPKDWSFIQPYVKLFGQNQISSGGRVRTSGGEWRPNMDGWGAVVGAGIIYQLDEVNQLHLDYEATFAQKYDKPWGLNFGFRHQF